MEEKKTIPVIESDIVDEFSLFDSWEDKYEYIIDMGKKLAPLSDEYKKEENKIKGCQSTVWMHSYAKDGRIYYEADSDAMIVKGLVSMLIRVFSGQPPQDVIDAPVKFIDDIGNDESFGADKVKWVACDDKANEIRRPCFECFAFKTNLIV
jgi:cysteine desulfuration protein SufE